VIGNGKNGAGHIQIARNHAAQVKRRNDPDALLKWADQQALQMKSRHSGPKKKKRKGESNGPGDTSKGMSKRQNQQGYEELHNLFSDTEVGLLPLNHLSMRTVIS